MVRLPFRRNTSDQPQPKVPKEVVDYYQAEQRDRRGATWLLGFATLIVTILLAFALFYGGRWAYRQIANNNDSSETVSQAPNEEQPNEEPSSNDDKDETATSGNQPDEATPSQEADDDAPEASTSGNSEDLPDTGPSGTVALFVLTTIGTASIHYAITRRRA